MQSICPFSTTPHFSLHLPNAEITLDLEVNEVEGKGLTSLASVIGNTARTCLTDLPEQRLALGAAT